MFGNPSLFTRIAIGKIIGFAIGLVGMFTLPYFLPNEGWLLRWGVLFWYTTFGAMIGVFGVFTYHPILKLPLPWWFRASWLGAWLNFVLAFFAYEKFQAIVEAFFGTATPVSTFFWFALEGALIGLLIGFIATRFGGEGAEAVAADQPA